MLTNFGQSARFLADVKRQREEESDKKKGFLDQLGQSLLDVGVKTAVGEVVGGTIGAYRENQQQKQEDFEQSEFAVEARRNNEDMRKFIKSYRDAQIRSKNNGTSFDEEFAKSDLIRNRALNELKRKKFYKESRAGSITDDQLFDYAQPLALAETKRNRAIFDDIYNQAKNVRSKTEFDRFIKENSGVAKTVFGGIGNKIRTTFQGKSLGDIAAERINDDPRYGNTLGAQKVLNEYITNRNEGQFINDLNNLKLSEMPDANYITRVTDVEHKVINDRIVAFVKETVGDSRTGETKTFFKQLDQDVGGTYNLSLMQDLNSNLKLFDKSARGDFNAEFQRRLDSVFPNGVKTTDGIEEPYNYLDYKKYNTPEGLKANQIGMDLVLEMLGKEVNFKDYNALQAKDRRELTELQLKYSAATDAVLKTYSNDIVETNDGYKVRFEGALVDPNDSRFRGNAAFEKIKQTYKEGKREIAAIANLAEDNNKIALGLELGLIQTRNVNQEIMIDNERVLIKKLEAIPKGVDPNDPYTIFSQRNAQGQLIPVKKYNFLRGISGKQQEEILDEFNQWNKFKRVRRFIPRTEKDIQELYASR